MTLIEKYQKYCQKAAALGEALSLIYWDMRTGAPRKGLDQRSEVVGFISEEMFKMTTSEEMAAYIAELTKEDVFATLDDVTKASILESKKVYEQNMKIPADEYKAYVVLQAKAESAWEEARENNAWDEFKPFLQQLVDTNNRFISYWGYEGHPYNALLDQYEPGMTVDILDRVFGQLKEAIVPLVKAIADSPVKIDTAPLFEPFAKEKQRELCLHILNELNFDFDKGRLDETVHPFATGISPNDVRITTRYAENDFRQSLFGTIHECGHALYEQNISDTLIGTPLCDGTSMGIHESQSLFYENIVARTRAFWQRHYTTLQQYTNGQFDNVSHEEFYKMINESRPSLIRVDADELTYSLHVMIRYEIEKGLFSGDMKVDDLPEIWNAKYEEYLGIRPETNKDGVLQDVHWAAGLFGYFPSYALGYMYAAQLYAALRKDVPNFDELLVAGDTAPILNWMKTNIHQYGKMRKPLQLLQDATGEGLNVQYLIDYLTEKYGDIYQLA